MSIPSDRSFPPRSKRWLTDRLRLTEVRYDWISIWLGSSLWERLLSKFYWKIYPSIALCAGQVKVSDVNVWHWLCQMSYLGRIRMKHPETRRRRRQQQQHQQHQVYDDNKSTSSSVSTMSNNDVRTLTSRLMRTLRWQRITMTWWWWWCNT